MGERPADRLALYPDEVVKASAGWNGRRLWGWVDAVAWAASRDPDIARLLSAHAIFATKGPWAVGAAHIKQPVSDADAATECAIVVHEFIEDEQLRSAGETLRTRLASDPHIIGWGRKGGDGEPVAVPATSWERGAAFRRGSENVLTSADGSDLWYSDLCIEGRGLLMAFPAVPKDGPTVAPRREQIATRQQKDLLTFFGLAERSGFMRGGHRQMNEALLIEEYERWVAKDRARGKAMGRTSFQKWRNRYDQGERWA